VYFIHIIYLMKILISVRIRKVTMSGIKELMAERIRGGFQLQVHLVPQLQQNHWDSQSIRKAYQSRSLHLFLFFLFKDYSQASPVIPREEVSPVTAPHDQGKTRTVCLSTMVICVRSSKRFLRIKNTMMEIIDEKIMTPVSDARGSGTCSFVGCSLYIMPLAFHFYLSCPIAFSQQLSPPFPSLGGLI